MPESESDETIDVSIVLPTFREAQNLPVLIPAVDAAVKQAVGRGEILVVDDDSGDGADEVCRRLAERHSVRCLVRKNKRGLASAVVDGIRATTGRRIVVMDADLSHPPEKIPELLAALDDPQVDAAVGSRYVAGGGTDDAWGWFRRLNSSAATLLARPLTKISDPMSGFFALRRSTFESAAPLNPVGYKILLEILVKAQCRNVREIPINFHNRLYGESKLSLKEQANYLQHLARLYGFVLAGKGVARGNVARSKTR